MSLLPEVETGSRHNISYSRYLELGGIINNYDYRSALERAAQTDVTSEVFTSQAKYTAGPAGIDLSKIEGGQRGIINLYGVLRTDLNPEATHHHGQMSDQRLFVEALRMLDYPDLLEKVISAYPNIDF